VQGFFYNGTHLVHQQDGIVVVTFNYRLGVLGWFAIDALINEQPGKGTGNYGLSDQRLVFQWVQQNIRNFGGDPKRVTIFGESAGCLSVFSHLASPLSKGFFESAICESGYSYQGAMPLQEAEKQGNYIVTQSSCSGLIGAQLLSCLRTLPYQTLVNISGDGCSYFVVVDGVQLPEYPIDAIGTPNYSPVSLMLGMNTDEGSFLTSFVPVSPNLTADEYPYMVAGLALYSWNLPPSAINDLLATYPYQNFDSPYWAIVEMMGDQFFKCPILWWTQKLTTSYPKLPVYLYRFNYTGYPNTLYNLSNPLGAYHGIELNPLWELLNATGWTNEDWKLAKEFQNYWTTFTYFSNPNPNDQSLPYWPLYVEGSKNILFDVVTGDERDASIDNYCAFWINYRDSEYPTATCYPPLNK